MNTNSKFFEFTLTLSDKFINLIETLSNITEFLYFEVSSDNVFVDCLENNICIRVKINNTKLSSLSCPEPISFCIRSVKLINIVKFYENISTTLIFVDNDQYINIEAKSYDFDVTYQIQKENNEIQKMIFEDILSISTIDPCVSITSENNSKIIEILLNKLNHLYNKQLDDICVTCSNGFISFAKTIGTSKIIYKPNNITISNQLNKIIIKNFNFYNLNKFDNFNKNTDLSITFTEKGFTFKYDSEQFGELTVVLFPIEKNEFDF